MPAYAPNPTWSSRGPDQCADCCQPYSETMAQIKWSFWSSAFPAEAGSRSTCAEVGSVWNQYFTATGGNRTFDERVTPASCVILSLKNDDDHLPHEEPVLAAVQAALPRLTAGMQPGQSATRPLSAVVAAPRHPNLEFNVNTRAGGSLLGGIGDSERGVDTRSQDGTIELTTERDGAAMAVRSSVNFVYDHVDGVDFCPGNTGERAPSAILPFALRQVSKVEASGMARDVGLDVHYTRRRFNVPRAVPMPEPPSPPPDPVRLPSRVLFEFGSAQLRPEADAEIAAAIAGAAPATQMTVVGHTDSKGSDAFNLDLSQRRAEAVRRAILRQRPDLAGLVSASGRGEQEPIEPNEVDGRDNPAGRARNRRVEISFGAP